MLTKVTNPDTLLSYNSLYSHNDMPMSLRLLYWKAKSLWNAQCGTHDPQTFHIAGLQPLSSLWLNTQYQVILIAIQLFMAMAKFDRQISIKQLCIAKPLLDTRQCHTSRISRAVLASCTAVVLCSKNWLVLDWPMIRFWDTEKWAFGSNRVKTFTEALYTLTIFNKLVDIMAGDSVESLLPLLKNRERSCG